MAVPAKVTVTSILVNDAVAPSIANLPHTNLETNIDNILSYLNTNPTGSFEQNVTTTAGLTFGYNAGLIRKNDVITVVVAGTIVLTASQTNYLEVTSGGTISANIVSFTKGSIPLWQLTTDVSSITAAVDKRTMLVSTNATDMNFAPTASNAADNVQTAIVNAETNAENSGIAFAVVFGS